MPEPYVRAAFVTKEPGWNMGCHDHPTSEMSLVLEGRGIFECRGRVRTIGPGHVVLIPAGVPHNYRSESLIRFGVLELGNMPQPTLRLFEKLLRTDEPRLQLLSPVTAEQYESLFGQFLRIISRPLQEEARILTAWMEVLILYLLQYEHEDALPASVTVCADYIRSNLQSKLSVADLARQCGLSESAFRLLFKQAFGVSPKQYQQTCRLEETRWLLRSTERPIRQIAELVGFASIHAFSGWFQSSEGMSPTDWRKLQKGDMAARDS
jgi:AraC family transcriptional regulator